MQGSRIGRLVGAVSLAAMTSGCVTTMGYVPEAVKPKEDKVTLRASYLEVKQWAADVADGYDSRATINRHSIYAGAVLAAASVSAIAGLAAFGSNSSALIGIPIGTSFLGALAAVYQSDEKAAIYGHGGRYVKSLIVLSEERIHKFDEDVDGSVRVAESKAAEEAAKERLKEDKKRYTEQTKVMDEANRARAARAAPTDAERIAHEKGAEALRGLVKQAELAVAASEAAVKTAEARTKAALHYEQRRKAVTGDEMGKKELRALFVQGEAVCLQQDVNTIMAKVADHIAVLDPKDLAARLKAVKAESKTGTDQNGGTTPGGGEAKATASPAPPRIPPGDLSDLELPAKSVCIY